jgi:putative ABC transport system ATP-binding protein
MLEVKNISKTFAKGTPNEHKALNHLSLSLKKGEFVTILGSNGAGKSTLFNAICGNFLPDEGNVILDGKDITFLPEHKRASEIGRLFQDPMKGTAPNLTIEENLALAYSKNTKGIFRFAITKKDREMFREALSSFGMGLEDRMGTKIGLLSGGQRQVVTLLMSTIVTPKLLLLDEHTAALDPATAEKVMAITNRIVNERQLTTLMITHNMGAALTTGTRTIMLDAGAIIFDIDETSRQHMTVSDLLDMYSEKKKEQFDNDRILLNP